MQNTVLLTGIGHEEILRHDLTIAAFLGRPSSDIQTICRVEYCFRYPLHNERNRPGVLPHLINGEHAVADKVGFRRRKLWKHQTGTIAEHKTRRQIDRLEMFRLSWCGRDTNFLLPEQGIDRAGFAHVGITDKADNQS